MEMYHDRLARLLMEKNPALSYDKARTWVELLWDDFETTYAKAGEKYRGKNMTEKIVTQWIVNYGDKLHQFLATNPKYSHLLNDSDGMIH
ncbi:YfhJ family protein [Metabacillus indicus]|uniref:YfhJ family protein n=1 Tax=Metabacillus indicus TaxID=246786 RepID=UPI002A04F328|nr:YfhJ family protein [Metabacillus indicus]MDX8289086.1 YfhJ family protein [Metabacillus indicus]